MLIFAENVIVTCDTYLKKIFSSIGNVMSARGIDDWYEKSNTKKMIKSETHICNRNFKKNENQGSKWK